LDRGVDIEGDCLQFDLRAISRPAAIRWLLAWLEAQRDRQIELPLSPQETGAQGPESKIFATRRRRQV